jgi:hypothetical protein
MTLPIPNCSGPARDAQHASSDKAARLWDTSGIPPGNILDIAWRLVAPMSLRASTSVRSLISISPTSRRGGHNARSGLRPIAPAGLV